MLRTKAMREKEGQREMKKYNYTLLRVRFPDGYILQGKRGCRVISLTAELSRIPFQMLEVIQAAVQREREVGVPHLRIQLEFPRLGRKPVLPPSPQELLAAEEEHCLRCSPPCPLDHISQGIISSWLPLISLHVGREQLAFQLTLRKLLGDC